MIVFSALVNAELFKHRSAKAVLGEHTSDCLVNGKVALFRHQLLVRDHFQTADVSGVVSVIFIFQLFTGKNGLVGVDNDDEIARVNVGSEGRFVFAAKNGCDFGSKTAERNSRSVLGVPLSFNRFGLRHIGFHNDVTPYSVCIFVRCVYFVRCSVLRFKIRSTNGEKREIQAFSATCLFIVL